MDELRSFMGQRTTIVGYMTKRDVQIAIAHARANGRESLARSLEFCWADVLAQPDEEAKRERVEGSTINGLGYEFNWDDVRLEL